MSALDAGAERIAFPFFSFVGALQALRLVLLTGYHNVLPLESISFQRARPPSETVSGSGSLFHPLESSVHHTDSYSDSFCYLDEKMQHCRVIGNKCRCLCSVTSTCVSLCCVTWTCRGKEHLEIPGGRRILLIRTGPSCSEHGCSQ